MSTHSHLRDRETQIINHASTITGNLVSNAIAHKDARGVEFVCIFADAQTDHVIDVHALDADTDTPSAATQVATVQNDQGSASQVVTVDLPMASHKYYKLDITSGSASVTVLACFYNFRELGRTAKYNTVLDGDALTPLAQSTVAQIDCDVTKGTTDVTQTIS